VGRRRQQSARDSAAARPARPKTASQPEVVDLHKKLKFLIATDFGVADSPSGGPATPTAAAITLFVDSFRSFCASEMCPSDDRKAPKDDAVRAWIAGTRVAHGGNRRRLLAYWRTRYPFFDNSWLLLKYPHFFSTFVRALAAYSSSISLDLPVPLQTFKDDESGFLCGIYELYHYTFADDGKINLNLVVVEPDPVQQTRLNIQIFVKALGGLQPHEEFRGHLFRYFASYIAIVVVQTTTESLVRARRLELPLEPLIEACRVKLGIISGHSVGLKVPVSARFLMSKISDNPADAHLHMHLVGHYDVGPNGGHALHPPYLRVIDNTLRAPKGEDPQYVLRVAIAHRPKPRTADSYPPIVGRPNPLPEQATRPTADRPSAARQPPGARPSEGSA